MSSLDRQRRAELAHWAGDNLHYDSIELPQDWPESSGLHSNGTYPTYCGEHAPGLTGLYAIVNGLKLLVAADDPLKPSEVQKLLEVGWNFMKGRDVLAANRGLRISLMMQMAQALTFAFSRRRNDQIACERVFPRPMNFKTTQPWLERAIVAKRSVIILLGYSEYTVLRGFTPDSWLLYDAAGRLWMTRKGFKRRGTFAPIFVLSRPR